MEAQTRKPPGVRVGEVLARDPDAVAQAMVDRILAEVPAYTRASAVVMRDVIELARRNSQVMCQAMASGQTLSREDLEYVTEHVRRRVQQGIGLEPLIHAYRAGNAQFWESSVAEAVRLGMSRDACLALAQHAFAMADSLTTHAAETYVREEARIRAFSRQSARDLLEILLSGDVDDVVREPHIAAPGLDPHEPVVVVVCDAGEGVEEALTRALAIGRAKPLVAARTSEVVAVVPARAERIAERLGEARQRLAEAGRELRAGVSLDCQGFAGVREGYRHAAVALAHAVDGNPIVALGQLPAYQCALLTAGVTTHSILAAKAGPVQALDPAARRMVTETVAAFAAGNMNITHTAQALHVHPNTLRYRLGRIRQATGYDPRDFHGLMELVCVLDVAPVTDAD